MSRFLFRSILVLVFFPLLAFAVGFQPPDTLSTAGQNASSVQVGVDPNGNLVAVWIENAIVKSNN